MQLLRQLARELDTEVQQEETPAPLAQRRDHEQQHWKVKNRAVEGGIKRAQSALETGSQVANDRGTLEGPRKLVAVGADEEERLCLKEAVNVATKTTRDRAPFNRRAFRNQVRMLLPVLGRAAGAPPTSRWWLGSQRGVTCSRSGANSQLRER